MPNLYKPVDINNNELKVGDYVTCTSYGTNIGEEGYIKSFRKGRGDNHIYVNVDNIHGTGSWSRVTTKCRKKTPPVASAAAPAPAPLLQPPTNNPVTPTRSSGSNSNNSTDTILTNIETKSKEIVNLINTKYNNKLIPIHSFEGKFKVVLDIIVPDLIKLYRDSPDIKLDSFKTHIESTIKTININDTNYPLVRDQKIILEGLVGILNDILTLSGSNYKHGIVVILDNLRAFFESTEVSNELWYIHGNERASPASAAAGTPTPPDNSALIEQLTDLHTSVNSLITILETKPINIVKVKEQRQLITEKIEELKKKNLHIVINEDDNNLGDIIGRLDEELTNYENVNITALNLFNPLINIKTLNEKLLTAINELRSQSASTPVSSRTNAPLDAIPKPGGSTVSTPLVTNQKKITGPPYYFRITREHVSTLYKSNTYPTSGTTIQARKLQVSDDKPVWIETNVDVEIPTGDPLSGELTMLNCPTIGGGTCAPCKTRKHRMARRKQRKSRKQRK